MARLPGPPLWGASWAPRLFRSPHTSAQARQREYGDVVATGVGPLRFVFLFGPDANRLILSERTDAFLWGPALRALLPVDGPTALVLSDGDDHRRRRRIVQPAFGYRPFWVPEATWSGTVSAPRTHPRRTWASVGPRAEVVSRA